MPEGTRVSLDNGYFSGANLRYLEQKGLDGYIPDSKQAQEQKGKKAKNGPYSKDRFRYDEEEDQFINQIKTKGGIRRIIRTYEHEMQGESYLTGPLAF